MRRPENSIFCGPGFETSFGSHVAQKTKKCRITWKIRLTTVSLASFLGPSIFFPSGLAANTLWHGPIRTEIERSENRNGTTTPETDGIHHLNSCLTYLQVCEQLTKITKKANKQLSQPELHVDQSENKQQRKGAGPNTDKTSTCLQLLSHTTTVFTTWVSRKRTKISN